MTWVRLESDWHTNPKVLSAGQEAAYFWLRLITWSVHHRQDGRVPREALSEFANPRKALSLAGRLVEVGLLERQGENFAVHDFLKYQPTKQELEQKRIAGKAGGKQTQRFRSSRNSESAQPTSTTSTKEVNPSSSEPCVGSASEEEQTLRREAEKRLANRPSGLGAVNNPEAWIARTMKAIQVERRDSADAERQSAAASARSFGRNMALGGLTESELTERCADEFAGSPFLLNEAVMAGCEAIGMRNGAK